MTANSAAVNANIRDFRILSTSTSKRDLIQSASSANNPRGEARAAVASKKWSFSARILLVHPEKGCTGVVLLETGKPTMHVDPTPEEVEEVRADLERRRAARLLWKGGATDTHDCAPA
jgi:uncharacterized hydantoinase/oxoprolinase family protein